MDAKTLSRGISVDPELVRLLEEAKKLPPMSAAERREQAISFAYGNVSLHNPSITKEMVAKAYDELHPR
jgi:hypothetical protein